MDRFIQYILPFVPGCPKPLIKTHALLAANEFCRKSFVWQEEITETISSATDEVYAAPYSGGADVVDINVTVNDRAVSNYTFSAGMITFESDLAADDEVEITLFLAPARDAEDLPDILYDDWLEGIAAGARATLMRMPGKDWYNPQAAMMEHQLFAHYIGQATIKGNLKNLQTVKMIKPRSWV